MSEHSYVRNELSGDVRGPVVQSGAIHGDVVFNSPAEPRDRESAEMDRRWTDRRRRILDAEEAQRAELQRRANQYVRACHRRRRVNRIFLPIEGMTVVLGLMHVVPVMYTVLGLLFGAISVTGWVQCSLIIRKWDAGRTIKVPLSGWRW
ncbi:hypothetical protein ABZ092_10030 [Streptomyces bobili]|uniref:hypothetical protein n=1 Tax=Streptomyces bobili TaxID=67280 RepID=UPI0033BB2599